MKTQLSPKQMFTPQWLKTLLFAAIMLFSRAKTSAQTCANVTLATVDTAFSWYEEDGEALITFTAQSTK